MKRTLIIITYFVIISIQVLYNDGITELFSNIADQIGGQHLFSEFPILSNIKNLPVVTFLIDKPDNYKAWAGNSTNYFLLSFGIIGPVLLRRRSRNK
jgi:hypothetical protein